ncbi:U32 family peptidase [Alkalilimnicola ehrlichii]|uniref:Ubiquinone biosynthesis protein UbiV n=1 Tax=Alkalilimnicola ehrlichii TaxID=351052 RepID=A0A3E0WU84_9GAMM|nr:U32 family peptidase [Alkalilimnicola ehrlichii]RFA29951.1 U32 family peptidase [Alkalilimnicola ehrlichii]RFA36540.1 U32 family peptidase [Alkalilimnicola ehrlichii]
MRISLGPVLYYWPRETLADFYDRAKSWPADIVYLGETVCAKRRPFRTAEWIELARELAADGKETVLSTLTLIEARSELGVVKRLCTNKEIRVEANDIGAVQLLAERGIPFVTGPAINIYNAHTLARLRKLGLRRWVMPTEMSRDALANLLAHAQELGIDDIETEVFSYGRLALAYSARCFTARHHNLPKDKCDLRCIDNPEGIPLKTQEGKPFLTINGIQTQSGEVYDLRDEWQAMATLGVDIMRVSPRPEMTGTILEDLRRRLDGQPTAALAEPCNGYWHGAEGMRHIGAAAP